MSKKKQDISAKSAHDSLNAWDAAIAEAQRQIKDHESKVAGLRLSTRTFERLRDAGESYPFPDEKT
jgi:hypothetical protein